MPSHAPVTQAFFGLAVALLVSRAVLRLFSRYKRVGKSRLRTFFTRETPSRWAMDHYSQEGYTKYHSKGQPFLAKVFGEDYWVLPPKYLADIKSAAPKSLSFFQALSDSFNMQASVGNLYSSNVEIKVVTQYLNKRFPKLVPLLADEADFAVEKEMGDIAEWRSYNAAGLCARLIHRTTSRVLVGPQLCRDEEYLDVTARFARTVLVHGTLWNFVALGPLRRLFAWLTIGGHRRNLDHATGMLLPVIQNRMIDRDNGADIAAEHEDMLQWILDTPGSIPGDETPRRQAHHLLQQTFAASSATGVLVTHALYQLLMLPGYVEPLRQEIERVLLEQGGWTDGALNNMSLLDSFFRETMRMYPAGSLTVARTVMDDSFTFHDGFKLQRGQKMIFPSLAIHMDPNNYKDPRQFDGFRFAKLEGRQKAASASTVDTTFLQFGYGPHACPGRFYAVKKAKLVLGRLLQHYEFQWDGKRSSRPPGMAFEAQMVPNREAKVLFRSRGPPKDSDTLAANTKE
ncbi:cytochrome P450 [Apiospora marii]|uniref:cytochrome P450 n=1 Tax=Apiospora marii TaxID=335849 RepID=UPI0031327A41